MFSFKLHASVFKISLASLIAFTSVVFSSCQDEDYGYTTEEVKASVYARNFEKMYGKISEDQTWDFSTYNLRKLGLTGGPSADANTRAGGQLTRAAIPDLVTKYNTGWYTVSPTTTSWLNTNLQEKVNNTKYVSSFDWEHSGLQNADPFYVIPIYQGQTGMMWDLELVDLEQNQATIIWTKSENLRYEQNFSKWDEFYYESWKANDAPATGAKNGNNEDDNKLKTVKFSTPLSKLPSSHTSSDNIIVAFSVKTEIPGSFWIKLGDNGELTKITKDNCEAFFNHSDNAKLVGTDNLFHFTTAGSFELGADRFLTNNNPNKVYLNALLGETISNHQITADDLKTMQFIIDDSFAYPTDDNGKFDHQYTFNTWGPDRIRVYFKYEGAATSTINLTNDVSTQYTQQHTINKYNVQTRPIKIDINKLTGKRFAFNLRTTYRGDGDRELSDIGDDHRSELGFMSQIKHFGESQAIDAQSLKSALSSEFSIELNDKFEYMVIGCEDAGAYGKKSDNDYNDLVLLLVGNTLPTQTTRKRYMIEDLGATEDFDFNDIVVDVTEKVTNVAGSGKTYTQTAAIRHLRGTIPFRVTIGTKTFGNGGIMCGHNSGGFDYDPSTSNASDYSWTYTVANVDDTKLTALRSNYWDPENNNIKVEVWPNYNSEDGNTSTVYWTGGSDGDQNNLQDPNDNNVQRTQIVEFPKVGKVPYIIATDQTVKWMDERISIPENWMATHPSGYGGNSDFHQGTDTGAGSSSGIEVPNNGAGNKLMNPTSLTAGSVTLKSDLSVNSSITLSANELAGVYRGEDIIIRVDKEKLYDNSRLIFKTGDGETISSIGVDGKIVATGDYKISLTSDMLSKGLTIECEHVTLTDITADVTRFNNNNTVSVSANATTIANSSKVIHSYSDGLTISNNDLKNLYVGDRIVVHVDNLRANSNLGFKKNTNNWPAFDYDGGLLVTSTEISNETGATAKNNANVTGDIVLLLNKDNINDIQNDNGLVINGQYVTITSVQIDKAGGCKTITNNNVVTGGFAIDGFTTTIFSNEWNSINVAADKFSKLSVGDKVVIHVDNLRGNGGNNSLVGVHQSNWTKAFADVTYSNNSEGNFYNVTGDIELNVTSNNIDQFKNGLILQGQYVNITGISIVPASTYSLKVEVMPWGAGSVSIDGAAGVKTYDGQSYGTTTLVASDPASGYEFLAWAGKGTPSTNRTLTVNNASTLWAYYGNVIFSGQSIGAGDYNSYSLFRVSSGTDEQKARYQDLKNVLTNNNSQLMIYFTDSNASGHIKLKTDGNNDGGWAWTNLPSIAELVSKASGDNAKAKAEEISFENGVAMYKLSEADVARIKEDSSLGLTILSSDGSLKISKIIVTSKYLTL